MTTADVFAQALRLPADDRRALADALSASLEPQPDISPELAALIDERLAEIEADPNAGRPADEVIQELRARFLPA